MEGGFSKSTLPHFDIVKLMLTMHFEIFSSTVVKLKNDNDVSGN